MSEIDPVSNVILSRLNRPLIPAGEASLDQFLQSTRHVNFQFAPNSDVGYVFSTVNPESLEKVKPFSNDTRLEPLSLPDSLSIVDDDDQNNLGDDDYYQYLSELFEINYSLENYKYPITLNDIGLKSSNVAAKRNQDRILYESIDSIISSLELLINKQLDKLESIDDVIETDDGDNDDSENGQITNGKKEELRDKMVDLKELLNVLNFIKAVYFSSDLIFAKNLSIWLNKSDLNNPPVEILEEVMSLSSPFENDFFFKFLDQLLLRGLFNQALNVLLNCNYIALQETNEFLYHLFENLIKLLNDYRIIFNGGADIDNDNDFVEFNDDKEFQSKVGVLFKAFKKNVLEVLSDINTYLAEYEDSNNDQKLDANERTILLFLKRTFTLLSGSKSTILSQANSWFEALNGLVLFDLPNIKLIGEYLEIVLKQAKTDDRLQVNYSSVWEFLCYTLLKNNNFLLTLRSLELLNSDTISYLSVLFEAKGFLKDYNRLDYLNQKGDGVGSTITPLNNDNDELDYSTILSGDDDYNHKLDELIEEEVYSSNNLTICQYLLYNHALRCFASKKLIPIGIGLLKSLNLNNFRQILTEFLPYNYYCESNDDSEWLLSIAAENKLINLSNNLYKLFGLNFYQRGIIFESLQNLEKAGDLPWISRIVWETFAKKLGQACSIDNEEGDEEENIQLQSLSKIDLLVDDEIDLSEVRLTEQQRSELLATKQLDPILKKFLAPYWVLLKYLRNETTNNFQISKDYLIKLVTFKYLPRQFLSVLLLLLLKYFYLNFTSGDSYSIGLSLFQSSELIDIIKVLNGLQSYIDSDKKSDNTSSNNADVEVRSSSSSKLDQLNEYYENFLIQYGKSIREAYSAIGVEEVPNKVLELIATLRIKISLEMSRKYLE